MSGSLQGVRVIDLTSVVMGPYATQILAELGADVIKVESPEGDNTRHPGPARNPMMGHRFLHLNRGKRSVVLNLKHDAGRSALLALLATADVFVFNLRPQAMARLGLSYTEVAAINPRLVYAGAYGYSQDGPYAARPAYDDLIQGMAAVPWLMQQSGAEEPRYVPATLFDRIVGLHAVYAITAALYERHHTGRGQQVEIPMFEAVAGMILGDHMAGRSFEPPLGPAGYRRVLSPGRKPFRTRDGYLCVLLYNDRQWEGFFRLIGRADEFHAKPEFCTQAGRAGHSEALDRFVAGYLVEKTTAEWQALLDEADIPNAPVNSLDDLLADPHLAQTGYFEHEPHPSEGEVVHLRPPVRWPAHPKPHLRPVPRFGEHGVEVLKEAGYTEEQIAALLAAGTVGDTRPNPNAG